ncbi:hypothetical protein [Ferruginibacter sp.]
MRIKLLIAIFICLPFCTMAQITFNSQLPNNGILLKDQLWNMLITNNSNDIAQLKLQLDVRDVLTGQSVINASSGKILMGKGMKLVTVKDVQPVMYNYVATEFAGNYLPCGSYTINYHVIQETGTKGDVVVVDEVIRITITPLAPPLLANPADKSNVETVYPQFNWIPPAPIQMFNPLLYDLTVVPVEDGQAAKDAMEFNKPAYINFNLQKPSEKMPSSFQQLQQGKTYAWQVVARSGTNYAIPTEIWTFTIGKDSVTKIIEQAPYIKISQSNTEVTIAHQAIVKMEYNNVSGDKKLVFSVYKAGDREKNKGNVQFELEAVPGKNLLQYDLTKKMRPDENTVYEIAVTNSRGEIWLMRFMPAYYKK